MPDDVITRVGYIGIGNIGEPIATNVLNAGFDLMVYDLRLEPIERMRSLGAKVAKSAYDLGQHAELLEVSIAGDEQIESALTGSNGVLTGMASGSVIALHSTMHPRTVRRIGEAAGKLGVYVVDAQVSGGKQGARAKSLCYMMGGEAAVVERCRPVFETSGKNLFHVGPLGTGASTKLAQQMITCMSILAVSEGMRVAERAGVDLRAFSDVVRVSAGQSYIADRWLDHFTAVERDLAEGFYMGLRPALELAYDLNLPAPGTALAQQFIRQALGHGSRD